MKLLVGLLVVTLAINLSMAVPVRDPSDDAEYIDVPKQNTRSRINIKENDDDDVDPIFPGYKGVVDTDAGFPFFEALPHPSIFKFGFFDDIFKQIETPRLWPFKIAETSSEEDDFSMKIDPTKGGGNTTSVVKVVDGHKIEINDTVFSNADKSGGSVFKFRIINIRPLDDSTEEEAVAQGEIAGPESTPASAPINPTIRNPVTSAPNSPANSNEDANNSEDRKESMEDNKPLNNEIQGNLDDPEMGSTEAIINLYATERLSLDPVAAASGASSKNDNNNNSNDDGSDDTIMASANDSLRRGVAGIGIEGLTTKGYGDDDGGKAEAQPAKVDKQFYGNTARSIFKSEKFVISSDNVNDGSSDDDDDDFEATATANSGGRVDDDFVEDDAEEGLGGGEKLKSKTDNFNESISVEIQNQQTNKEEQLRAESEVADVEQQQEQQDHLAKLKLTMEVGEKSKSKVSGSNRNEGFNMQQQNDDERLEGEEKESIAGHSSLARREDNNSSSDDDDNDYEDNDHQKYQKFNAEWESLGEDVAAIQNENNDLNNDIDVYDNVPSIDLSNDIAINDVLAAQDAPHNPDAEVFSVDDFQSAATTSPSSSTRMRQPRKENLQRTLSEGLSLREIK